MGKGNHVYNNQFKTIQKAFNDVKSHFKLLDNDLPESARIIGNIMGHRLKDKREKMMDDKEVFPDDKNSIEYGNCVKTFYESIFDWVNGVEGGENPLKGYLEDRRLSSNCDPYVVTAAIVSAVLPDKEN
uniref:Uncharacterized protein n=1 Tax=Panagrolaimus davidi TaxID=227884 RepID=A0A914Q571_9BILA